MNISINKTLFDCARVYINNSNQSFISDIDNKTEHIGVLENCSAYLGFGSMKGVTAIRIVSILGLILNIVFLIFKFLKIKRKKKKKEFKKKFNETIISNFTFI